MATWMSVDEVARVLGRSGESLRKLVYLHPREVGRKDLPDGHRFLVNLADVRRLVDQLGR
jgi:hypothetical protein